MYLIPNSNILLKILTFLTLTLTLVNLAGSAFVSDPPFYSQLYAKIPYPRSIVVDQVGDILVSTLLYGGKGKLFLLYEIPDPSVNGSIQVIQDILFDGEGMNLEHGIALKSGFLYASSASTVYRWPYISGQRQSLDNSSVEVVIANIPSDGLHISRTIIFDKEDLLYVQVGSFKDIDPDSNRSRIVRFNIAGLSLGGIDFNDGEVFADGVRNEVGLAFDSRWVLWGVENGANRPVREDLGVEIWKGNPAEELNRFNHPPGTHYGYPYCFSSYLLDNYTANTQFVYSDFMTDDSIYTDDWCADVNNNQPAVMALPAHTAPLGIEFYDKEKACDQMEGAFPCSTLKDAFITFHSKEHLDVPTFLGIEFLGFHLIPKWNPLEK